MRHVAALVMIALLALLIPACGGDETDQQVKARNLNTGEVKAFSSAAEVPKGWTICSDPGCTVPPQLPCQSLSAKVCTLNPECRLKELWCVGSGCACPACAPGATCPPCSCPPPTPPTCEYTCIPKLPLLCNELKDEKSCVARPDCSWGQFVCPMLACVSGQDCPPCPFSCIAKTPKTCDVLSEAECKARPDCGWGQIPCPMCFGSGCPECKPTCTPITPPPPVVCGPGSCGPALGMPNYLCPDGKTVAGPTGKCLLQPTGTCGWEVISCPTQPVPLPGGN